MPNFDTLTVKGKIDCKKYYKIMLKDIRDAHPYVITGFYAHEKQQANKKGGKNNCFVFSCCLDNLYYLNKY